jgi:16S rRNA (guanine966-N2)-methyltransferase
LGSAGKSEVRPRAPPRRGARARVLRIIGGSWRGRKLRFPDRPDLRPTPDRVRETLFNWLGTRTVGARCLDLFAGSGALGLEALSRGAAHVSFIERDPVAARELRARLAEWQASGGQVECTDALQFLNGAPVPFGVVFLDPPFGSELLLSAARRLAERGWLLPEARIYVESPARGGAPELPGAFSPLKAKQAGEVGYHLYAYSGGPV